MSLNELTKNLRETIILGNFINQHSQTLIDLQFSDNVHHWLRIKAHSRYMFF